MRHMGKMGWHCLVALLVIPNWEYQILSQRSCYPIWCICWAWIPHRVVCIEVSQYSDISKLSRLWNGSTECTSPVRLHGSPQWSVTCEFMGQASQEDTGTELSRPGQHGIVDEDGWKKAYNNNNIRVSVVIIRWFREGR